MTKLTVNRLEKLGACTAAIEAFKAQPERDPVKLIREMIETEQHLDWASWLITRLITKRQAVRYAVYAASQVLDLFEKEYPDDTRPREAIEAAKAWLKRPTKKNRDAARAAAWAVADAADDVWAATSASHYAAHAAYWAIRASDAAVNAARAAYYASNDAAIAAAYADRDAMQIKILKYGLTLLK